MATKKYVIVADESKRHGPKYSYFYGGCILEQRLYEKISSELDDYKSFLGLNELKREKITPLNLEKYKKIIDMFFLHVRAGEIKMRIMLCPNGQLNQFPHGQDLLYSKLYYIFLKRAFSLFFAKEDLRIKILLDELPERLQINKTFKRHLVSHFINQSKHSENRVFLRKDNIIEVDSKEHVILQYVDVILGVIEFYMNHDNPSQEQSKRGKAKIDMFIHILINHISRCCPVFSLELSTGYFNCYKAWMSPYKHLVFKQTKKPPK